MRKWMWIVVGLAACSDHQPPLHSDAGNLPSEDAPLDTPVAGTTAITVETIDPAPIYLAVKDSDAAWEKLDLAASPVVIHVHDRYQLLAVCDAQGNFDIGIAARVVADGATVKPTCIGVAPSTTAPPAQIAVSGSMKQQGRAYIGRGKASGMAPDWPFQITTTAGKHHIIAISSDHRAMVQHAVDLAESQTLPELDVTAGDDMVAHTFDVTNGAPGGTVTNFLQVTSELDGMVTLGGDGTTTAHALSKTQAGNDFAQRVAVSVDTDTTDQVAFELDVNNLPASVALIPALTQVTFATGSATWGDPLPDGVVQLEAFDADNFNVLHIDPSQAYLGTRTTLAMSLDGVPQYLADWQVSLAVEGLLLDVHRASVGEVLDSFAVPPTTLRRSQWRH